MKRMILLVMLAVMIYAFSFVSEVKAQTEVKFIKIATASPGGLWYLAGGKLAAEIKKAIPAIETSSTTGGSVANATAVNKGTEIQLAFNNAASSASDMRSAEAASPLLSKGWPQQWPSTASG